MDFSIDLIPLSLEIEVSAYGSSRTQSFVVW